MDDSACGPACIRMVIDYYLKPVGVRLCEQDWDGIVKDTMNGSIYNVFGTSKKNLKKALEKRGFSCEQGGRGSDLFIANR